jgi:Ca-activated chloride channel family protein
LRWADPELLRLLWLLPLVLIAGWLVERRRASLERLLGDPAALRARSGAAGAGARWWRRVILLGAIALAIVALARPQAGFRSVTTTSRGVDLVVALDLSRSMDARDVRPDRLRASKREAASLVTALEGSSIGLVGFAGEAQVLSPLSTDLEGLTSLIESAGSGDVDAAGSDLGKAIERSARLLKRPGDRPKAIVIVSDGENLSGDARGAIPGARAVGARIFTIGIGSSQGAPIPIVDERGRITAQKRDPSGHVVISRLDESLLRDLARRGGGQYERADATGRVALRVADAVRSDGGTETRGQTVRAYDERFGWFAALAGLFLVGERVVPRRRKR